MAAERRTGGGRLWQRRDGRACRAAGRGGGCERLLPRCRDIRARKDIDQEAGPKKSPTESREVRRKGRHGYDHHASSQGKEGHR